MILLLFRIAFILGLAAVVYYIIQKLIQPSDYIRCSRCDGKGYWLAARGRETCDWCKGSGKLPRTKK